MYCHCHHYDSGWYMHPRLHAKWFVLKNIFVLLREMVADDDSGNFRLWFDWMLGMVRWERWRWVWAGRNGWVGVDFFSLIVNNIRKILFLQLLFYLHQFGQNWSMSNSSVAQTENQGKICKKVLELSIFPKYESYSTQIGPFPCQCRMVQKIITLNYLFNDTNMMS